MANKTTADYNAGVAKWDALSSTGITGALLGLLKLIGGLAGNISSLLKLTK